MTLSLMLCGMLIGAVLTFAATVVQAGERAANRPVRWVWVAMMALTVLLTAVVPSRARFGDTGRVLVRSAWLSPTVRGATGSATEHGVSLESLSRTVRRSLDPALEPARSLLRSADSAPAGWQQGALAAWALASIAAGLVLLTVYRRVRRSADAWTHDRLLGTEVRVSSDAGPAVVGVRPMEIVVPRWILARPDHEQRLVLAHELEHIRARDPLLLLGGCVAVALMPWNPLLWYALSRLRLAVEIDCDRRVLGSGVTPLHYGRLLLDLSEHESSLASALPALAYHSSHLERRLIAMTARPTRFALARRVSGGVVAAAALLAACESRLPTSAEVESMDAASAVTRAAALPGIDTTRTLYVIDGKQASGAQARTLTASKISSIEVVRGADRTAEVRLRTKGPDSMVLSGTRMRFNGDSAVVAEGELTTYNVSEMKQSPTRRADMVALRRDGKPGDTVSIDIMPTRRPLQRSKSGFDGLFVIDGRVVSSAEANSLLPDRIGSIEVLKSETAVKLYNDPRAVNGVIRIKTKP